MRSGWRDFLFAVIGFMAAILLMIPLGLVVLVSNVARQEAERAEMLHHEESNRQMLQQQEAERAGVEAEREQLRATLAQALADAERQRQELLKLLQGEKQKLK